MRRVSEAGGADGSAAALAIVRERLPDAPASDARFLSAPDTKKNVVVRFRVGDDLRVLKVYRHGARYALRLLTNPISRWGTRAFTLRGTVRQRISAELLRIDAFGAAGLPTFDVLARPDPSSLVYAFCPGRDVRLYIRRHPERARALAVRVAEQLAERQQLAYERRDIRLIHPQPRLNHVWRARDGRFVHFDFEDRVNPSLALEEALALEVEGFFRDLVRFEHTQAPDVIAAAAEPLGGPSLERWRVRARQTRRFSGSARRRRGVFETVLAARSACSG